MALSRKVAQLKLEAALAVRHALFWESCISKHGEEKATAFYSHLGLNHLNVSRETKSTEWEGLTLSREPRESEKIAVKGIAQTQESAKVGISEVLLTLRNELIADGLEVLKETDSTSYQEIVLQPAAHVRIGLRQKLRVTYKQGRALIARELGSESKQDEDDEFDDLDLLTDISLGRVVNDVQSRLISSAQRLSLVGTTGDSLITAVQTEMNAGSVSYIERTAQGLANRVISIGRSDEAEERADEWNRITYSAILDLNTCGPCSDADGEESDNGSDLEAVPNASCAGGDYCRCFWVYITV